MQPRTQERLSCPKHKKILRMAPGQATRSDVAGVVIIRDELETQTTVWILSVNFDVLLAKITRKLSYFLQFLGRVFCWLSLLMLQSGPPPRFKIIVKCIAVRWKVLS